MKPKATLSLDLDNLWSYMKVHGDAGWEQFPSYFDKAVPIMLDLLRKYQFKITVFVVGQDAVIEDHHKWLREIAFECHEFGNHSHHHEPWMGDNSPDQLVSELKNADLAIKEATGKAPVGFRGPGFCMNKKILEAVSALDYSFDASLLPTIIGPVARLYYSMTLGRLPQKERQKREQLFGEVNNGFLPIQPFMWQLEDKLLLEIPVSTLPFLRIPFHFSYILWIARFSRLAAINYFKMGLNLCLGCDLTPSFLLHPLDFLGEEDAPQLHFFPGMDLDKKYKLAVLRDCFRLIHDCYDVIPMSRQAHNLLLENKMETKIPS